MDNPFGPSAPAPAPGVPNNGGVTMGNPFDPVSGQALPPQQQQAADPFGGGGIPKDSSSSAPSVGVDPAMNAGAANPFGAPTGQPQPPVQAYESPAPASAYGQSPYAQPPPQPAATYPDAQVQGFTQTSPFAPAPQGQPPVGMPPQQAPAPYQQPPQPQPGGYDTSAMVPSQQQSSPYALPPQPPAAPVQQNPYGQALVPSEQQSTPWGAPPAQAPGARATSAGSGGSFDPFAPPPPPAPAPEPAPAPVPPQQDALVPAQPPAAPAPADEPFGDLSAPTQDTAVVPHQGGAPVPDATLEAQKQRYDEITSGGGDHSSRGGAPVPARDGPGGREVSGERNPYANEIARMAPPGASPLPKAELVRKKGYVLGRISFRTIVMKKWKQTFWVQYGPHTMLWFRSQADFEDWLNNPYHGQTERNFLIKLAVNFVHDLYKPNVRGYQVTQCRTKAYGQKMIRQFKLERWMDYGPTIAAAFGSYNPKEVDDLREAIVECMRNTPLNGGIRATGAVRQQNPHLGTGGGGDQRQGDGSGHQEGDSRAAAAEGAGYENQNGGPSGGVMASGEDSVADEKDLLDVDNWDDVPSQPTNQFAAAPDAYAGAPPGQPMPPQQHPGTAMVPAGGQQAYPGAPPPQYQAQQPYQQPPYQQQQQVAPQYQQSPYAAAPPPAGPADPWATPQAAPPPPAPY